MTAPLRQLCPILSLRPTGLLSARRAFSSTPVAYPDLMAKFRRRPVPPPPPPQQHNELPQAPVGPSTPTEGGVTVAGVRIPERPPVPGDEACCMSGCVHCVLTLYAEDLEAFNTAVKKARAALEEQGVPRGKWPAVVTEDRENPDDVPKPVDPTMAAFMALEMKLKKK